MAPGAGRSAAQRVILHLDMDAFYAAVEVRENPSLAGKPLIIGHSGRRGVVSTCSYEARGFGVHSAMPSVRARLLCPQAVWLPGRMGLYVEASRRIRDVLDRFSPVVEPLSIDEAFLDLTGIARDLDDGARIAGIIKRSIVKEERLTASVGVSPNKFLAKVASDMDKPDGLVRLASEDVPRLLWPLPVERLWGVGPRTAERLHGANLRTIEDLHRAGVAGLEPVVGSRGAAHLVALSEGRDSRPVVTERKARSISEERTYGQDLRNAEVIDRALLARSDSVARQLRRKSIVARTVELKVRTGDFTTWTRSLTLPEPTDLTEAIVLAARTLMRERIRLGNQGVRLLGVGVSGLEDRARQRTMFEDPDEARARRMARVSDEVRDRMGESTLTRARLLRRRSRAGQAEEPGESSSLPSVD